MLSSPIGDETLPHLPFPEFSFGVNVNSADEMRKAVRMFLKYGVDSIKLNLSGDNFTPDSPAETTWMSDAEVAAAQAYIRMTGTKETVEDLMAMLDDPNVGMTTTPHKTMVTADFMHTVGTIRVKPADWRDMWFPEIHGRDGS